MNFPSNALVTLLVSAGLLGCDSSAHYSDELTVLGKPVSLTWTEASKEIAESAYAGDAVIGYQDPNFTQREGAESQSVTLFSSQGPDQSAEVFGAGRKHVQYHQLIQAGEERRITYGISVGGAVFSGSDSYLLSFSSSLSVSAGHGAFSMNAEYDPATRKLTVHLYEARPKKWYHAAVNFHIDEEGTIALATD